MEADRGTRGDLTLERGAAISGRVVFEDGSPVPGVAVQVESAQATPAAAKKPDGDFNFSRIMTAAMSGGIKLAQTDDRGEYRIAGLPAGEYRVEVKVTPNSTVRMTGGVMNLNSMMGASPISFYAPGALHESAAQTVSLKAGEDRGDVDVQVNLTGMHSVSGRVGAASDHHPLNAGVVTLTDSADKQFTRRGAVTRDGSFTVNYVPSGSYTLTVSGGEDTEPAPATRATGLLNFQRDKVLRRYATASQPLVVGEVDVTDVSMELKPGLMGGPVSMARPGGAAEDQ